MTQLSDNKSLSPCVRNCCLDEQDICLGCFRHLEEITGWQRFTREEKVAILAKCSKRQASMSPEQELENK